MVLAVLPGADPLGPDLAGDIRTLTFHEWSRLTRSRPACVDQRAFDVRFVPNADIQHCLSPAVFFEMFDETQLNSPLESERRS
jgi:hypothetical protein